MNERIRQLAKQAEIKFESHPQHSGIDTAVIIPSDLEKFAELIVRECISVMKSTVDESIDFERKLDETSSWIESDIKKYFGVEE